MLTGAGTDSGIDIADTFSAKIEQEKQKL